MIQYVIIIFVAVVLAAIAVYKCRSDHKKISKIMCLNNKFIATIRHSYLSCYQVLSTEAYQPDMSDPATWGSGFLIEYKGRKYFISALHVIDPKNYPDFNGWKSDPKVGVISGFNDEKRHCQNLIPIGGFYEYVKAPQPLDKDDLVFPDPIDLAFARIDSLNAQCQCLGFDHSMVKIVAKTPKEYFTEQEIIVNPTKDGQYFVVGSIFKMENALNGGLIHQLHLGLKLIDETKDSFVMETPYQNNKIEEWSGLSGSPVISDTGQVIGMLTNASDCSNRITVMKIESILRFIDQSLRMEDSGVDLHEPAFIVGSGVDMEDVKNNSAIQQISEILDNNPTKSTSGL